MKFWFYLTFHNYNEDIHVYVISSFIDFLKNTFGNYTFFYLTTLFFFFLFLFLAVLCLHCCVQAFSSCGEGGYSSLRCGARASHCSGYSCCRAWALGMQASVVAARGPQGVQASVVATCGLSTCSSWDLECWLSSCGSWA